MTPFVQIYPAGDRHRLTLRREHRSAAEADALVLGTVGCPRTALRLSVAVSASEAKRGN